MNSRGETGVLTLRSKYYLLSRLISGLIYFHQALKCERSTHKYKTMLLSSLLVRWRIEKQGIFRALNTTAALTSCILSGFFVQHLNNRKHTSLGWGGGTCWCINTFKSKLCGTINCLMFCIHDQLLQFSVC